MPFFAIIVAGGKGLRMGADLPKQFLPIGGRPVLMHTLEVFERAIPGIHLILVLPADHQPFWRDLCRQHSFTLPHSIATGGATRFHSVKNGLKVVEEIVGGTGGMGEMGSVGSMGSMGSMGSVGSMGSMGSMGLMGSVGSMGAQNSLESSAVPLVAVHDGVRPFVSPAVIRRTFEAARDHAAVVPVVPVVETLRQLSSASASSSPSASSPSPSSSAVVPAPSASSSPSSSAVVPAPSGSSSPSSSAVVPAPSGAVSSFTVDRSLFRLVQTPQTFQLPLLLRAYEQPFRDTFTDDASVVEALGHPITLVEGNRENIKITTPFDLTIAEALLHRQP